MFVMPSTRSREDSWGSQPLFKGGRRHPSVKLSLPAPADEYEQQGAIPAADELNPGLETPAEQFRCLMWEKFRELDVELQRVLAMESMHRKQILTSTELDIDSFKIPVPQPFGGSSVHSKPVHARVQTNPGDLADTVAEPKMLQPVLTESDDEDQPHVFNTVSAPPTVSILETPRMSMFRSLISTPHNREDAPQNAFVLNVRRLIDVHDFLTLLHGFLTSTAIAAITLVAAGSANQFIATLVFLPSVFALYAMHEQDWDKLEVEDIKMLLPLLCDDSDPKFLGANPNRLFKAITVSRSRFLHRLFHLFHSVLCVGLTLMWLMLEYRWRNPVSPGDRLGGSGGLTQRLADYWLHDEEDQIAMGMQVTVATLMFLLKVTFEYIHWRETSAVMPCKDGEAWDPRRHGTPPQFWLFGMPSMWFTSEESLQKLKRYIEMASPSSQPVRNIYPQELAYYALSGHDERAELQRALNHCKLFDGCRQSIIFDAQDQDAQPLALDLCFFDHRLQHKSFPYPGEFMYYLDDGANDPENEETRSIHMVPRHQASSASVFQPENESNRSTRMIPRHQASSASVFQGSEKTRSH